MTYDLLLRHATIADGTGGPLRRGSVAIADGTIVDVADDVLESAAHRVLDCEDLVVAPGFIDLHTHTDFTLPAHPRAQAMVRQGVTTLVMGNCGASPFPIDPRWRDELIEVHSFKDAGLDWDWATASDYRDALDAKPLAVNAAMLVGHGTVRIAAMGFERRAPTDDELGAMCDHVAEALDAGAFGLSTGLSYAPAIYSETAEVVALAAVAAERGAIYTTHLRSETGGLIAAVEEALDIGRRAEIPAHISHHKVLESENWGAVHTTLAMIDGARHEGHDVTLDQYPYDASSTTLLAALPRWTLDGGIAALRARLTDPPTRARVRAELLEEVEVPLPRTQTRFDPGGILLASIPEGPYRDLEQLLLLEAARRRGVEPVELLFDLIVAEGGSIEIVTFGRISEDDLRAVMRHPLTSIASDGWTLDPSVGGRPHPRSYGTFVRVLGHYVREEAVLTLPDAVRKMTSLPAARLGLTDRGVIAPGMVADLAVFDPHTVADAATFADPHQFAVGVPHVIVGGDLVIEHGADTGAAPGSVLRRPGSAADRRRGAP